MESTRSRRTFIKVICSAAGVLLVGCASSEAPSQPTAPAAAPTTAPTAVLAPTAAKADATTPAGAAQATPAQSPQASTQIGGKISLIIQPVVYNSTGGAKPDGLVADFKKRTGTDVEVVTLDEDPIFDRLQAEFAAKSSRVDVFLTNDNRYSKGFVANVEPLDDYVKSAEPDYKLSDVIPSLIARYPKPDGAIYGLPFRFGAGVLYYRKDILDQLSMKVPETMADFEADAARVTKEVKGVFGVTQRGRAGKEVMTDFERFLYAFGASVLDPTETKTVLTTPEAVAALQLYADLLIKGYNNPDMLAQGRDEYLSNMEKGAAAMSVMFQPYWGLITDPKNSPELHDKFGAAVVPTGPKALKKGESMNSGWIASVSKYSKGKKASWELVRTLTDTNGQARSAIKYANGPCRTSSFADPKVKEMVPVADVWSDALAAGRSLPSHPKWELMEQVIGTNVVAALQKQKTAKQALEDAAKQISSYL